MKSTYISWGYNIVAEIAAKLVARNIWKEGGPQEVSCAQGIIAGQITHFLILWFLESMSHHNKGVKAQGSIDGQLDKTYKRKETEA